MPCRGIVTDTVVETSGPGSRDSSRSLVLRMGSTDYNKLTEEWILFLDVNH